VEAVLHVDGDGAAHVAVAATGTSDARILPLSGVGIRPDGHGRWVVSARPEAVGIARLELTVTDPAHPHHPACVGLVVGALDPSPGLDGVRHGSGSADASAAIPLDDEWMLVADDEDDVIRLYSRTRSGPPAATFPLAGVTGESDLEAAARDGDTVYWLGSFSDTHAGRPAPERDVVITTRLHVAGERTRLETHRVVRGGLRAALATAPTSPPELQAACRDDHGLPDVSSGCNLEGFELAPDGMTGLLGFRAPLIGGVGGRALVMPLADLVAFAHGAPAVFGEAILLDLGGRGIRDLRRNPRTGTYLLTAAAPDDDPTGPRWALFSWDGTAATTPERLADLPAGAAWETVVEVPDELVPGTRVQLLSDDGAIAPYGDGVPGKHVEPPALRTFRIWSAALR
jgi:hypothetical protein